MPSPTTAAPHRPPATVLVLLVSGALCGTLVACSPEQSSSPGTTTASSSASTSPVTVTHAMGTTTIPADPGRIVSFSSAFTDAFSALGRPVDVEYRSDFYADAAPWEPTDVPESRTYPLGQVPDVEDVAAADPDVIFAGYLPDQATYDRLNKIAPTIAAVGGSTQTDSWRDATTVAGQVLGKTAEAEKLIGDADAAFDATTSKYPALDGATGAFGQISGQGLAVVTGDTDPANEFLSRLGIVIPDNIRRASSDGSRAFISEENTDLLDTDLLLMWPVGITEADVPTKVRGWDDLRSVKNGSGFLADNTSAQSLGTPTILSISWSLDKLDPVFAAVEQAASTPSTPAGAGN